MHLTIERPYLGMESELVLIDDNGQKLKIGTFKPDWAFWKTSLFPRLMMNEEIQLTLQLKPEGS